MRTFKSTLAVAGLVGLAAVATACDSPRDVAGPEVTAPTLGKRQSNSATPEVPAGQRPQPNPNKSQGGKGRRGGG